MRKEKQIAVEIFIGAHVPVRFHGRLKKQCELDHDRSLADMLRILLEEALLARESKRVS